MVVNVLKTVLGKLFKKREEAAGPSQSGDVVKPFLEHLEDLRWTIMKMVFTLFTVMVVCFLFAHDLFKLLEMPLVRAGLVPEEVLRSSGVAQPIMAAMQLSFYASVTLSFPLLMYFLGEFILPALTTKEKKYILPGIGVGFLLFLSGVLFSFWNICPKMINWLANYSKDSGIKVLYDMKDYFGFVAQLCIAFGLLCELPVVMVTLNLLGLVSYKWMASTRAYAMAAILVLAVIICPTADFASIFILAFPIIALYEMCIWIIWYLDKRRAKAERSSDPLEPID